MPYPYYQNFGNYNPMYYQQPQPQQHNQQIQNGGFVSAPSMDYARSYPVAPGNSVTFKDENSPYIYVKTKGFSQLEEPIFKKFRLIEESDTQPEESTTTVTEQAVNYADFAKQADVTALWSEIEMLKKQITELTAKPEKVTKRKEVDSNV